MQKPKKTRRMTTRALVILAMYAALASVLRYLEFPLAFLFPSFLQIDFSNLPVLLSSFHFGPLAGVAVALVKNLIYFPVSKTGGIGELADFLYAAITALAAGLFYRRWKTRRGAVAGLVSGGLLAALIAIPANYFIMIPFYENFMPMQAIIDMCSNIIPFVQTKLDVVVFSMTPFNLFKYALMGLLTFLLYKRVRGLLK